jgi:hypothetical protein
MMPEFSGQSAAVETQGHKGARELSLQALLNNINKAGSFAEGFVATNVALFRK